MEQPLLDHASQEGETALTAQRMEAAEILRGLVRDVVLTPKDGDLVIDLRGDLAGILAVAAEGMSGDGVQKRSKPLLGAALSTDLVQQVEMVAGARCQRCLLDICQASA